MTNDGLAPMRGERVRLPVPLAMAALGLIGAAGTAQLAGAAADSPSSDDRGSTLGAGPASETASPTTLSHRVAPTEDTDDGQTDSGATDDGATDDGATDDGATDDGATDDGADRPLASSVAEELDCPPLFVVRFPLGSAVPLSDLSMEADELVSWMAANPDTDLLLEGHADAAGSEEANLQLSFHRAEATADLLADAGSAPERLLSRGFGEYQPVAGAPPDSERNRRVTMRVPGLDQCPIDDKDTAE